MPPGLQLNTLGNSFLYLTAFLGAFVAALWLSLIFWAYRDIRGRSDDRVMQLLAALVVALLGPPGVVVYLILRPPITLEQAYQQSLEEEALLRSIESRSLCPGCGSHTHSDWQICPNCHTHLRKPCRQCAELLELTWQICPHCGTPVEGSRLESDQPPATSTTPPTA